MQLSCICYNNEIINCIYISKQTYNIAECLKIKIDRINKILEQISFEEHNELKHSVREIVIWLDDCFTCFHCLYPFKIHTHMTLT